MLNESKFIPDQEKSDPFTQVTKYGSLTPSKLENKELYIFRLPALLMDPSSLIGKKMVIGKGENSTIQIEDTNIEVQTIKTDPLTNQSLFIPDKGNGSLKSVHVKIAGQIIMKKQVEIKSNDKFCLTSNSSVHDITETEIKERNFYEDIVSITRTPKKKSKKRQRDIEDNLSHTSSLKKKKRK